MGFFNNRNLSQTPSPPPPPPRYLFSSIPPVPHRSNRCLALVDAVASWLVCSIDSGASGKGSTPDKGHCVVFLGKTLYPHGASLYQVV